MHGIRRFAAVVATATLAAGSVVALGLGPAGAGPTCSPAPPDADGRFRLVGGPLTGKNFYSGDGFGQNIPVGLGPGQKATFEVFFKNVSDAEQNVAMGEVEGGTDSEWIVRYFLGTKEITGKVTNGVKVFRAQAPGENSPIVTVTVRMRATADEGASQWISVRGDYAPTPFECGDTLAITANFL